MGGAAREPQRRRWLPRTGERKEWRARKPKTDAERRKSGEQKGLETPVVQTVNDVR